MKGSISLFFLIIVVFISCKNKNDVQDDSEIRSRYYNLQNVGWKSREYTQNVDDIIFKATEVPIQYYMLKDKGNDDLKMIDSLYEINKRERIIEFTFLQNDEKDLLEKEFTDLSYVDAVRYMSFSLNKDFYVVTSKGDTIGCSGVNYERNFKVAPSQKVLLFFSNIDPNDKIQLIYNDFLFKKGILKFKFKEPFSEIAL